MTTGPVVILSEADIFFSARREPSSAVSVPQVEAKAVTQISFIQGKYAERGRSQG